MPQKTYMYDAQWNQLINAINTGDSSAVVTALNTIKYSLDNITNAISNQTITVDLSDINSDNVLNLSNVTGRNITNAFNNLNSTLSNKLNITDPSISGVLQDSDLTINNKQIINGSGSTVWVGNPNATTILQDSTGNKNVANLVDKNPQEISLAVNGGIASFVGHAYRIGKVIYVSGQLTAKQNINTFSTIISGFPTPKDGFDILVPTSNNTTGSLYVTQAGILSNRSNLSSGVKYIISGSYIER